MTVIRAGGRGIGEAIALLFPREGAAIVVSSRTASDLDTTLRRARVDESKALAVGADAADRAEARPPVQAAASRFGRVDVLVNNIGGSLERSDPFAGDDEGFEGTLVLSVTSAWWTTSAAPPRHAGPRVRSRDQHRIGCVQRDRWLTRLHHGPTGIGGVHQGVGQVRHNLRDQREPPLPRPHPDQPPRLERTARVRGTNIAAEGPRAASDSLQRRVLDPEELTGMAKLLAGPDGRGIT